MYISSNTLRLLSVVTYALAAAPPLAQKLPFPNPIKNLVTFGDSYTSAVSVGDRGTPWPIYAGRYGNLSVFDFAISGAVCSNILTPRSGNSVMEEQLPTFEADIKATNGSAPTLEEIDETLFTLWIGTNDVGNGGLLTGKQANQSVSVVDTTRCAIQWLLDLYDQGWRNFIYQNMLPLNLTPLYSRDSYPNIFWDLERNTTEWNIFMAELVLSGNEIASLMLANLPRSLPGATIGLFNSYALFTDMYNNPANYLNGTDPLNVTFPAQACILNIGGTENNCTTITGPAADSYLWVDELHPSEQADRIVARELVKVINGTSKEWITWFH